MDTITTSSSPPRRRLQLATRTARRSPSAWGSVPTRVNHTRRRAAPVADRLQELVADLVKIRRLINLTSLELTRLIQQRDQTRAALHELVNNITEDSSADEASEAEEVQKA